MVWLRPVVASLVVLLIVSPGATATAQIPGESIFSNKGNVRDEYVAKAYEEVRRSLSEWNDAINRGDSKKLRSLVTPDLFLGPAEGWLARGPEALDSLAVYAPRMGGYLATIIDFDASGSIAYVYASIRYQYAGSKGRQYRELEAAMVLFQRGDQWRLRSYIERPRLDLTTP